MRPDVVIVGHESARHIERAIGALAEVADVVVVDNASHDDTVARARASGARVVENDVNAGFGAAANQGANLGHADVILFLNPDAAIEPAALERLVDELRHDPALAVLSPRIRYEDGSEQRVTWPFPSTAGAWQEAIGLHRLRGTSPTSQFVIGACFLMRRDVFEELGGFDTRYWLYGEETDLCRRAIDAGWQVRASQQVWAVHVGSASRDTAPDLVAEHFERGGERFVADRDGRAALVSYRFAKLTGSIVRTYLPGSAARRNLHRARMRRYARTLRATPTTVALDSPATSASNHTLVVCSLEAWDDVWRRNQFLVRELLAADPHLRVLFVEPPFDWLLELRRRPRTRRRRRGIRRARSDGRVLTFEPGKVLPRVLGPLADRWLERKVVGVANELGFRRPTLWINDADYAGLLRERWPSVYDITDDWLLATQSARARRRLATSERALLRDSHAVVVCSPALADARRSARADLRLIPNAVDREHFVTPRARPADLPSGPTAVYVGTLHEDRLDVELLVELAQDMPELDVVLVGPSSLTFETEERLGASGNIRLLGAKPYHDVPAYLQHAEVVIVPHVVSPFTDSLDPIKAYECLVVGRPTVATPVAGFRDVGPPFRIASRADFAREVTAALVDERQRSSRPAPSWPERAQEFAAVLSDARAQAGMAT